MNWPSWKAAKYYQKAGPKMAKTCSLFPHPLYIGWWWKPEIGNKEAFKFKELYVDFEFEPGRDWQNMSYKCHRSEPSTVRSEVGSASNFFATKPKMVSSSTRLDSYFSKINPHISFWWLGSFHRPFPAKNFLRNMPILSNLWYLLW